MDLERARDAVGRGDAAAAIPWLAAEVERDPSNVQVHLLLARAFLRSGQTGTVFQLLKTLIRSPGSRGHAPLPAEEVEALMVDAFLAWGRAIEGSGFPREDLDRFAEATDLVRDLPGRRTSGLRDLLEGLRRKRPVTATFEEILRRR